MSFAALSRKGKNAAASKAKAGSCAFYSAKPRDFLHDDGERATDRVMAEDSLRPVWSISKIAIDPPDPETTRLPGGDVPKKVQAKLTINQPGDLYEKEADRVASQVMGMRDVSPMAWQAVSSHAPQVQRKCSCGGSCDNCMAEQRQRQLQRKHTEATSPGQTEPTPTVHEVLRSPGQPLDLGTRAFVESRLGQDFSRVRVHSGTLAAESARDISARAYTSGHHIVFGDGEFSPLSHEGRSLLVHELAHVIQQTSRSVPTIQRKVKGDKDPDKKKPPIVKIVAFAGSTDAAVAYRADGSPSTVRSESLDLHINLLNKGEYTLVLRDNAPRSEAYNFTGQGGAQVPHPDPKDTKRPLFGWRDQYELSESIKVVIFPRYIEDFLTDREGSKPSASPAEVVEIIEAAQVLAARGVTEDQLVLEQHKRMDAEDLGRSLPKTDMVSWARSFVEEQHEGEKEALDTRASLDETRKRLDQIPPGYAPYLVTHLTDETLADEKIMVDDQRHAGVLERMHFGSRQELWTTLGQFSKALDSELRSLATAVLNAAEAVGLEAQDRYIGSRNKVLNPAVLENQLTGAREKNPGIAAQMKTIRDEQANAPGYKQRISDELSSAPAALAGLAKVAPKTVSEQYDESLASHKDELNKSLAANSNVKIGKLKTLDAFDLLSASPHAAQFMLSQALADARSQIRRARKELSDDDRFVYGADKIIDAKKKELQIIPDGTVDQVVDGIVKAELSKETLWETIWGVIDFIVNLLPIETPLGLFLRTIAAGVNAGVATDKYATQSTLNAVDFSESAPSASGLAVTFLITAGGVVFDAHATGVLKAEESGLKLGLQDEAAHLPEGASAEHLEATHPNELKPAEGPAGAAPLPDEPIGTIQGDAGKRHATYGKDHEVQEVEDPATHFISCEIHSPEPHHPIPCPAGMGERAGEVAKGAAGEQLANTGDARLASVQDEIPRLKSDIQTAANKDAASLKELQRNSQEMETAKRAGTAARNEADAKAALERYKKAQARVRQAEADRAAAREQAAQLQSELRKKTREAELLEVELGLAHPWRGLDVQKATQDELSLYGELEMSSRMQAHGFEPAGNTINPNTIKTPRDFQIAVKNRRGLTGTDGVYKRGNGANTEWAIGESKATADLSAAVPKGRGKLGKTKAGEDQLSRNYLEQAIAKHGLSVSEKDHLLEALEAGEVHRFYSHTTPRRGTVFYEVTDAPISAAKGAPSSRMNVVIGDSIQKF